MPLRGWCHMRILEASKGRHRVMLTFLEFYTAYVKFVLYKLYKEAGLALRPALAESCSFCVGREWP